MHRVDACNERSQTVITEPGFALNNQKLSRIKNVDVQLQVARHHQKHAAFFQSRYMGCLKPWCDEWTWCPSNSHHFTGDCTYFPCTVMHQISVLFPGEVDEDSFEAGCVWRHLSHRATIEMDAISNLHAVTPKFSKAVCMSQWDSSTSQVSFFKSTPVLCRCHVCH